MMLGLDPSTRNILQLGTSFFLVFTAYNSAAFTEEVILDGYADQRIVEKHAGYNSQAIIYLVFTFSNFFSPSIVKLLGVKWAMFAGACTYAIFHLGFMYVNEIYIYVASAILGVGAAIIWTAQGNYLALNSNEENSSKHSGLVWATTQACLICGGLFLFLLFRIDQGKFSNLTVRIMFGVFIAITIVGMALIALLEVPKKGDQTSSSGDSGNSLLGQLKETVLLAASADMRLPIILFMYSGLSQTFYGGIYPTCIGYTLKLGGNTKQLLALNMIFQGVGQTSGGYIFGILGSTKFNLKRFHVSVIATVINFISFALIFVNFPEEAPYKKTLLDGIFEPKLSLAFLCGLLLGFADACWNTQIYSLLISKFSSQSSHAFCIFKFFQSLLCCAGFFFGKLCDLKYHLILLMLTAVTSCTAFFFLDRKHARDYSATRDEEAQTGEDSEF